MADYLNEDWNSTSPGITTTPGSPPWACFFTSATVYLFNQPGNGVFGGQYPTDHWLQFPSGGLFSPVIPSQPFEISLFFGFAINQTGAAGPGMALTGLNAAATGTIGLISLRGETNNSLTLLDGTGNVLINTSSLAPPAAVDPTFIYSQGIWYYVQINLKLVNNGGVVQTFWEIAINGISLGSGSKNSGVLVSDLFTLGFYQLSFGAPTETYMALSRIVLEDQVPIDTYPNPGTPMVQATQMVIEPAYRPTDSLVEASQMVIEFANFPATPSSVDISQMVIEVAYLPGFGQGFPQYIKRRHAAN